MSYRSLCATRRSLGRLAWSSFLLLHLFSGAGLQARPVFGSIRDAYSNTVVYITTTATAPNGLTEPGWGTGVIVDPRGYVLTCNHVVKEAEGTNIKIVGALVGSGGFEMHVVSRNQAQDLALLKFDGNWSNWPVAPLGDAATVKAEDSILVLGFSQRTLASAEGRVSGTPSPRDDLWKTTAPINSGDSGAPAFNELGRVVGIAKGGDPGAQLQNVIVPISASAGMLRGIKSHEEFQRKAILSALLGRWQAKWADSQHAMTMTTTFTRIDRLVVFGISVMDTSLLQGPARGAGCHFEESLTVLSRIVGHTFVVSRNPTKTSPAGLCDNDPQSNNGEWKDFNHWSLDPTITGGPALVFERLPS